MTCKCCEGKCAECGEVVEGWKPVFGAFAPEWWQAQREQGINPADGHKISCSFARR